jgi:hypothetical protein
MSERQACRLLSLSGITFRYKAQSTDDHELAQELLRLAERQSCWGYGKMVDYLRNKFAFYMTQTLIWDRLDEYNRQYAGVVLEGKKIIYANYCL